MNENYNARHEYVNLDLLRAVAVLCVFFSHIPESNHHRTETTWHLGQLGVLIFFVHTSLVLMQSMQRLGMEGGALFKTFYLRRWFRIYPLSIFCVLLAYISNVAPDINNVTRHWNLKELATNLTLTQNLFFQDSMVGGLWTLPLEVQMYVVLPFLFVLSRNRRVWWLLAVWVASVPVAIFQLALTGRLGVLSYVPCFMGGVIAWRMEHLYKPRLVAWLWPIGILAVAMIWFSASREYNMYYRWAFCLVLGLVIPLFKQIMSPVISVPSRIIARYSYGIYLSHVAIMVYCFDVMTSSKYVRWGTFVLLTIVVPILMYHLLESPMIAVGRNLTGRNRQQLTKVRGRGKRPGQSIRFPIQRPRARSLPAGLIKSS